MAYQFQKHYTREEVRRLLPQLRQWLQRITQLRAELGKLEACLATLGSSLTTPYDEEFIAQKRKALQEQGISLLTITVEPQQTNIH